MAAKRTCGRYVTPFDCISGDFVSVVLVVSFWLFWWFRFGCSGGFGGFIPAVPVVPVVSFRRFRFGVSGFSTCQSGRQNMETFAFSFSACSWISCFQDLFKPSIGEKLVGKREFNNTIDKHAVKVVKRDQPVGHLPRKFSLPNSVVFSCT